MRVIGIIEDTSKKAPVVSEKPKTETQERKEPKPVEKKAVKEKD